ncbi:hypothetical protein DFH05DRAFT_1588057 [Lentinula detonsa]|uniref:Protein kinase domain-containing protein n=1 Tax=Lentinula detonsa TaxID=2804962 RepID=A0A9W8P7C7_9AGAR|nr:hypothetical protein DFH05DRAFT_1588057 [Lentinula detonsa]
MASLSCLAILGRLALGGIPPSTPIVRRLERSTRTTQPSPSQSSTCKSLNNGKITLDLSKSLRSYKLLWIGKKDIKQHIRDLALCGVAHGDFRMSNLVRSSTTTEVCPHHERVHEWKIIDFDRAWVLDL